MSLTHSTLHALKSYLEAEFANDPPSGISEIKVNVGRWMDNPPADHPLITLHENNVVEDGSPGSENWPHRIVDENSSEYIVEMGYGDTCSYSFNYRYTIFVEHYLIKTDYQQEESLQTARTFQEWLIRKLVKVGIDTLRQYGMDPSSDEVVLNFKLVKWNFREGGGPPTSYIYKYNFFLTQLVQLI